MPAASALEPKAQGNASVCSMFPGLSGCSLLGSGWIPFQRPGLFSSFFPKGLWIGNVVGLRQALAVSGFC